MIDQETPQHTSIIDQGNTKSYIHMIDDGNY